MISAISNFQNSQIAYSASISATKKSLDNMEMQGNAALKLINSAPSISTKEIDGKGNYLDLIG
jgi:hypothetical protein